MRDKARYLFDWRGTVPPLPYAIVGVLLIALKFALDKLLALAFDRPWTYFDYWSPGAYQLNEVPRGQWGFYASLVALAIPFLIVGLSLTVRRLRDANLPLWLVVLFFIPAVNLLFFVVLALTPSRSTNSHTAHPSNRIAKRLIPRSRLGSAAAGVALTGLVGITLVAFGTETLGTYGWGLFVGVPFCLGLLSSLVYNYWELRDPGTSLVVGLVAAMLVAAGLLAVAIEGAICIVMAMPLAVPLVLLGAYLAHVIQRREPGELAPTDKLYSIAILLPLLMVGEAGILQKPPPAPVTTSVVVNAPPEVVWRRVVSFPKLPPPRALSLKTGVAYPIGASIEGSGVGAIRRCVFSTGAFIEPITVWDEPRLLRFDVTAQPAPMKELSPWGAIDVPHLDGFLRSRQGQFKLTRLSGGRTRLEGTTWYDNQMWPQAYWKLWSDTLIHDIHGEVLRHVAQLAEADVADNR